jgi:hypothetical protein
MGKDLDGKGGGLIEVLSRHLPGEEYHEKPVRTADVRPRFQPSTTAILACSVTLNVNLCCMEDRNTRRGGICLKVGFHKNLKNTNAYF